MQGSQPSLIVVGASVRAAAQSALRAGFQPMAADLFADADLRACCQAVRIEHYPAELPAILASMPGAPWMYTGALENHPHLIDTLAALRPLLGNHGDGLRHVRDPFLLFETLAKHGFSVPDLARTPSGLPLDGSWLRKPFRSASGIGIDAWHEPTEMPPTAREFYFQRRVAGTPCAAIFVGRANQAELIEVSEQLVGPEWGAGEFRYAGSIGPIEVASSLTNALRKLGDVIANEFGLIGLFGVDGMLTEAGFTVLEVNPRYTASIEVLERATGWPSIADHVAACRGESNPPAQPTPQRVAGKAILYATDDMVVPPAFEVMAREWNTMGESRFGHSWPLIADLPEEGAAIECGWPIATVFASGAMRTDVRASLKNRLRELESTLGQRSRAGS